MLFFARICEFADASGSGREFAGEVFMVLFKRIAAKKARYFRSGAAVLALACALSLGCGSASALNVWDLFLVPALSKVIMPAEAAHAPVDFTGALIARSELWGMAPKVTYSESSGEGFRLEQQNQVLPNGDFFWSRRICFERALPGPHFTKVSLPGTEGTVRYYDYAKAKWESAPADGTLPQAPIYYIETASASMIISCPALYRPCGNESLEAIASGQNSVTLKKEENSIGVEMRLGFVAGAQGHVWAIQSAARLIEWTPQLEKALALHFDPSQKRWLYDGFYVPSPSSYSPFSKDMFWRCPAAYTLSGLSLFAGESRGCDGMLLSMLGTAVDNQTEGGWWKTGPESSWLRGDYGIGAGFFDTRFSSEAAELMLKGYVRYGDERFLKSARNYADFLSAHALRNSFSFSERGSILVEDYSWPGKISRPTHSSLNHQLQEMRVLYLTYGATGNEQYRDVADRMLRGINDTLDRWIMPSGNLEYAYMADGGMGLSDYPYLTYNDLLKAQQLYEQMGRPRDPGLQRLLESKKDWMDKNGVTGYMQ